MLIDLQPVDQEVQQQVSKGLDPNNSTPGTKITYFTRKG